MSSMYVFTQKCGYVYCFYKTYIGGQKRTISTDVNLLGLDETSSVVYKLVETQTCNFVLLFGRDRIWRNPRKSVV